VQYVASGNVCIKEIDTAYKDVSASYASGHTLMYLFFVPVEVHCYYFVNQPTKAK
jgi:hypothetical protein